MNADLGFIVPSQLQLDHLMAGCFVRIQDNDANYWVEVEDVVHGGLVGVIHAELDSIGISRALQDKASVCFQREQVTHVGCERYCFC